MEDIRQYLIGIMVAAILCGIISMLLDGKGTIGVVGKLLAGLLMILAVISPWTTISFDGLFGWASDISCDGSNVVTDAYDAANTAYRAGIKERIEAYVLEKAKELDCTLTVDVTLSEDAVPKPFSICLKGSISPYAKAILSTMITEDLGIVLEEQLWTR